MKGNKMSAILAILLMLSGVFLIFPLASRMNAQPARAVGSSLERCDVTES
jgi:hypothetical protein